MTEKENQYYDGLDILKEVQEELRLISNRFAVSEADKLKSLADDLRFCEERIKQCWSECNE